jgi:hypothetical protein
MTKKELQEIQKEFRDEEKRLKQLKVGQEVWIQGGWGDYHPCEIKGIDMEKHKVHLFEPGNGPKGTDHIVEIYEIYTSLDDAPYSFF